MAERGARLGVPAPCNRAINNIVSVPSGGSGHAGRYGDAQLTGKSLMAAPSGLPAGCR